jgi:hypothetical protein
MLNHERALRRSRLLCGTSTVLFVLFCLGGSGSSRSFLPPVAAEAVTLVGYLAGIGAWTCMSIAYEFRRRAI